MMKFLSSLAALGCLVFGAPAQNYTPTEFTLILYKVELSTDGTNWVEVFENTGGLSVDLVDPNAFANAFGAATDIPAGTYRWIRMDLSETLEWSYPSPPISLSNQTVTISGPPGPTSGVMTAYFATHDQGGQTNSAGGDGSQGNPLLLGRPAVLSAGSSSVVRLVFNVTNTLQPMGGGYDLGPPLMFFVAENASAALLSGTFNTVLYNTVKLSDSGTVIDWSYSSGHGVLTFDGASAWSWTGTNNDFDLLGPSGSILTSQTVSGNYGINDDGTFWMMASGQPGTMHGAISADGDILFASMYDSPSAHMMVFGVEQATSAALSAFSGGYYFATYGSSYNAGSPRLDYRGAFGVVNVDGSGGLTGTQDQNVVAIADPTGTPSITPPTSTLANAVTDTISLTTSGQLSNASGKLAGGLLSSGEAGCIAFDFDSSYTPTHDFGFFVKQSPASTFTNASLDGTYFGGHFGDNHDSGSVEYFSGVFTADFDGQGTATVTVVENYEGTVQPNTFTQLYSVDSATGLVSFTDTSGNPSSLRGAIGPDAALFVLGTAASFSGSPNDQRFLGIGLKQP